ncbi:MAG: RNA 3'-terminal phosphate cyclase [Thermodesulfovibrionales bacterium]|nr:RNA 3'-terminal phosphate cyclase [Thermodesulfovibrionales bacterium]
MIEIDGSFGEGGGQILRTALSLSSLFLKPFRIFNIRKGRKKSGLMPQHLTCVRAMQLISDAEVAGDKIGSSVLVFKPKSVKAGEFFFDIGTAGSTSLVLQTIVPSLIFSSEKTSVILKGGTHVPFSPSFDYIAEVFAPVLGKMGIRIELKIESYGFYPKGGGKIRVDIFPAKDIKPLRVTERGAILMIKGYSGTGNLPLSIAERQKSAAIKKIQTEIKDLMQPVDIEILNVSSPGQGTFIYLHSETENAIAGFTSLGERGKKAETVGEEAAEEFSEYYFTNAAFDRHLPDQIVLYLSMSKEESIFTTSCITQHLMTNLWVIGLFTGFHYSVAGTIGETGVVKIK